MKRLKKLRDMSKQKNNTSFWLSYADLMTSLFFIMLVLFIVSYVRMSIQMGELRTSQENIKATSDSIKIANARLEQIVQLKDQFKELDKSKTLQYDSVKKAFMAPELEGIEIFKPEETEIKPEYKQLVDKVGGDLNKLLETLHKKNPDFSFLLVIEGTSANDGHMDKDRDYNYKLSFERSLALYKEWTNELHLDLRKYNTELLLAGSGLNGKNRDLKHEPNNKRFVIQIIPKILKPVD